jgi:hypothetical protein
MKGSNKQHAIGMAQYGVEMIVFTTQEEIDEMAEQFMSMPMSQVRSIHKRALSNTLNAAEYFKKHPERLGFEEVRYQNYCDDCLIVTVSGIIGFNKPGHFIHPSLLGKIEWDPSFDLYRKAAGDLTIYYDPDIPLMQ